MKQRNKRVFPWIVGAIIVLVAALVVLQWVEEETVNVGGLAAGTKAPTFTLDSTQGEISLSDYKGEKVVLYFYEGNSCQACIDQLAELNQSLPQFEEENAVVLAAVTDPLTTSQQIANELGIQVPIMHDPNHALGSMYGVYNVPGGMDMGPVDTHSVFVIDEEGVVRWHEISTHEMYVPLDSILRELKNL